MAAAGVRLRYERADVTSPAAVREAVRRFEADLGPVTAVVHGAGANEPRELTGLTEEHFRTTLAPKIDGPGAVLDADRLTLLLTFGSIIGRAGLRGEAHYATANDWLTELTVQCGARHPPVRALALEWSVWSGAGMGERLGVVEGLAWEGIAPIATETGIAVLRGVLADPSAGPVLVVTGPATGLPTLTFESEPQGRVDKGWVGFVKLLDTSASSTLRLPSSTVRQPCWAVRHLSPLVATAAHRPAGAASQSARPGCRTRVPERRTRVLAALGGVEQHGGRGLGL